MTSPVDPSRPMTTSSLPDPALPRRRSRRRIRPDLWVSPVPYGIGFTKPNHYLEIAKTIWENRRHPRYAWRILSEGVCDGCALGVAGFRDWTIEGVHLCTTRLNFLKVNTMGPLDPGVLAAVEPLRARSGAELRELGRLAHPMLRRAGEAGFRRIGWEAALDLVAAEIRAARAAGPAPSTGAARFGFYLTARGLTNEVYYAAAKVARFLGTNNVDNAARVCHAPSTGALKRALGVAATTISYRDVFDADLVVLFGSDVANAQPVFMKYLYLARKDGLRVAVVNPYREPGLERYWVPSNVESAIFGTKMTDEWFQIHTGGDVAFIDGVLKCLLEIGGVDETFVEAHTTGWPELRATLEGLSFDDLERWSGASRADMERFAHLYAAAERTIFIWSMGITQHVCGTENVLAIVNLALARGERRSAWGRAHADPRSLGRPGWGGDGGLRDGLPGRRSDRARIGGRAVGALGLPGPRDPGPDDRRDARGGRPGRDGRPLQLRGELPRHAAGSGRDPRGPRPPPTPGPPGHRAELPDARRSWPRRGGPPPAGRRDGRRLREL